MSRHDAQIRLGHMLQYAEEAVDLARGRQREDLDGERSLLLALMYLVTIVGEAASQIPRAERASHRRIPWRQIIGTRNRLIHAYGQVDTDILWEIVAHDLPPLIAELRSVLEGAGRDPAS